MKLVHDENLNLGELRESEPMQYAEHREALKIAEELDKEDLFDHLLIPDRDYAYRENDSGRGAGIKIDQEIHSDQSPILPHQHEAVRYFLGKFRGVGILADEVGMGKTIEAGMVLSELAERKSIGSLLVVAENLDNWKTTLESMFGVPPLTLVSNASDILRGCAFNVPKVPMMMSMKNFCALDVGGLKMCFDAIVVDEAHNFGMLEEAKRGMYVLSHLMKAKLRAQKPYCILVSGTPHNGTLDSMFPLWYFITSRGQIGDAFNPDAKPDSDDVSARQKAYAHYHDYLCNGANTIAEFIEKFKIAELQKNQAYEKYLSSRHVPVSSDSTALRDQFLKEEETQAMREGRTPISYSIRKKTNDSYQALLGSFMIRQSRCMIDRRTEKKSLNYYFCPTKLTADEQRTTVEIANSTFRTDARAREDIKVEVDFSDLYGDRAVVDQGRTTSLDRCIESLYESSRLSERGINVNETRHRAKTDLLFNALENLKTFRLFRSGADDELKKTDDEDRNYAQNAATYYYDMFDRFDPQVDNRIELIDVDLSIFTEKAVKFSKIAQSDGYKDKRIIVFFNYYSQDQDILEEPKRLYDWLGENAPDVCERVVFARDFEDSDRAAEAFVGTDRAILFADEALSESHNLQHACSTVVNFSICYNPIKMDQRIGRIDRIGQQREMNIVSFADMNSLEGFLLAFYNQIGLFSGWRDDIILVTGCDNENSVMKRCKNCGRIVLSLDDASVCPNCQGNLYNLENTTDYSCNTCKFTLTRTQSKYNDSFAYICSAYKGGKSLVGQPGKSNSGHYRCDKKCLIQHCNMLNTDNCHVKRLIEKNYDADINMLKQICMDCVRRKLNVCKFCSIATDALECAEKCPTPSNRRCKPYEVVAAAGADCPICAETRREGKLIANTPTTFDSFAKFIWKHNDFVANFRLETDKIYEILATLRSAKNN